jgi:hypothetical protein
MINLNILELIIDSIIVATVGTCTVEFLVRCARKKMNNEQPKYPFISCWIGCVERILYVIAFLSGYPEFVAVWLGFKVASTWSRWSGDQSKDNTDPSNARTLFNIFVFGNGLSLLVSLLTVIVVHYLLLMNTVHVTMFQF